jgi:hypothetical protein
MLSSQFVYMLLGVVEIGAPCSSLISNYRVVGEMPVLQVFLEFSPARFAVFFENHPDIGQITGRRVRI